jgi:hypothetical protein
MSFKMQQDASIHRNSSLHSRGGSLKHSLKRRSEKHELAAQAAAASGGRCRDAGVADGGYVAGEVDVEPRLFNGNAYVIAGHALSPVTMVPCYASCLHFVDILLL